METDAKKIGVFLIIVSIPAFLMFPGLVKTRKLAYHAEFKKAFSVLAEASEMYSSQHSGLYPTEITDLTKGMRPYVDRNVYKEYCNKDNYKGYYSSCIFNDKGSGYAFIADQGQGLWQAGPEFLFRVSTGGAYIQLDRPLVSEE